MALILTQTQADRVYSAMSYLNDIGATILASLKRDDGCIVVVCDSGSGIIVNCFRDGTQIDTEHYPSQEAFRQAHELL